MAKSSFEKFAAFTFTVVASFLLGLILRELVLPSRPVPPIQPPTCESGCLCGKGGWCCCHGVCKPKCPCNPCGCPLE